VSGQSSEHLDEEWLEPPTGLRKFNLGTIPASVTPPRTWRRAAWFAGGTAAFVACALGLAAIALNGHTRRGNTIEALPGQPSQRNDASTDSTSCGSCRSVFLSSTMSMLMLRPLRRVAMS